MAGRKPKFSKGTYFDYPTLFLTLFLALFGLIMIYSTSSYMANIDYGDGAYYFKRQFIFMVAGLVFMFLLSRYRYQRFKKFALLIVAVQLILLVLVLIIGDSVNGSTRWIYIGPIGFQPSEIAKLTLIIFTSAMCSDHPELTKSLKGFCILMIAPAIICGLIVKENLSTAVICIGIVVCIWFVATTKPWLIAPIIAVGFLAGVLLIMMKGYRGARIEAWLHPETAENGYQTMQALYAIGSGGVFGRGLGQSIQKMGYIPFAQNDMIFSVVCEELGIVGAVGLLAVFVMLLWRFKFIAEGAPDKFGAFIVIGVLSHIGIQVIINVAVVTNVFPNTGVPLPFISYGGSSLTFLLLEIGIALSVSRQIKPTSVQEQEKLEAMG
ncbi:MAG: cell division protein FtsW [Eubacterium sp.]|nr:cell division protein FtsW [Eubacterium sp.]